MTKKNMNDNKCNVWRAIIHHIPLPKTSAMSVVLDVDKIHVVPSGMSVHAQEVLRTNTHVRNYVVVRLNWSRWSEVLYDNMQRQSKQRCY